MASYVLDTEVYRSHGRLIDLDAVDEQEQSVVELRNLIGLVVDTDFPVTPKGTKVRITFEFDE